MMKRLIAASAVAAALAFTALPSQAEDAKLTVIVFPGVQNLPMFAAQANGFYAKRGLDVEIKFTPNSDELRNGLAQGRYQIAHSAIDNAFAMKDKANVDTAVVSGGDNSFNHLIVQPEIETLADLRGKTVAVEAPNTAYAFQLYEMLRQKGLNKGDYEVKPVGGTGSRLEAMTKDKAMAAAMMNPPFSVKAVKAGLKDMGTQAVALLAERLKLPADVAEASFEATKRDFDRERQIDMAGVTNVLKLRAQFEGGMPASPDKYLDPSYYTKARAGL